MSHSPFPWSTHPQVPTGVYDGDGMKVAVAVSMNAEEDAALIAAIPAMVSALQECAAQFSTSPGSVSQCQTEVNAEFKRRMGVAAHGLAVLASIGKTP